MLNYSSIQVTATATATAIARALTTAASGTITEIKSRPWVGEKLTSKTSQEGFCAILKGIHQHDGFGFLRIWWL